MTAEKQFIDEAKRLRKEYESICSGPNYRGRARDEKKALDTMVDMHRTLIVFWGHTAAARKYIHNLPPNYVRYADMCKLLKQEGKM